MTIAGTTVPVIVAAQDDTSDTTKTRTHEQFDNARKKLIESRCKAVENRINAIHDNAGHTIREKRDGLIESILEKLNTFASRAETAGYDVTELKADINQLKVLTDTSAASWDVYTEKLDAILDIDCTRDAQAFHDALESAKDAFAELKSHFTIVKDFFTSDIKPDLADIRQQIADSTDSGSN